MLNQFDDNDFSDVWVNNDSPDVQYIEVDSEFEGSNSNAVLVTVGDITGTPFPFAYDLGSIDDLISDLQTARSTLLEMQETNDDI